MRGCSILLIITLLAAGSAAAQTAPEAYSFYTILGQDTISIEQVIRTIDRVDVDLLDRQRGVREVFTLDLTAEGKVRHVATRSFRHLEDAEPTFIVSATFRGDSVDVDISGAATRTLTVGTLPGALPWIVPSNTLLEQALLGSKRVTGTIDSIPFFMIANGQSTTATIEWEEDGTATIRFAEATLHAEFSEDGSLTGGFAEGGQPRVVRENAFNRSPIKPLDYGPPEGAPYGAEEVTVRTPAGLDLSGTLTLPGRPHGRAPAVVTITGSGQQDRDERISGLGGYRPYWELADTLGRIGIATLRLDDRGVNDSDTGPAEATFVDYADDVRAALDFLKSRPEVDGRRLALVGHSQGGLIAPLVAADDPTLLGIVLMAAPGYVGSRVLEAQRWADLHPRYVQEHEREGVVERSRRADSARAERDPNLRFLLHYDPIPTARKVRVPVLILQGETDVQVTPEQADTLALAIRSAGNTDVTVHHFADLNHFFLHDPEGWSAGYGSLPSKEVSKDVLGAIADWLMEHLNVVSGKGPQAKRS
jgi:dipeptidyl aminopeptidase/acylaminoacyl peptidase